jgi:succinate dehydrogenase/fumarate reductase flavoprotein subunit
MTHSIPECDVLVIGAGASGLCAALTAACHGLKVIVIEKEPVFGGTTAWAGGYMWIPRNPYALRAGFDEPPERAREDVQAELGTHYNREKVQVYLDSGPRMVSFLEMNTRMRFEDASSMPDMHARLPGAATGGRAIRPAAYDGRELRGLIQKLRPPKDELTVLGMAIAPGADMLHFMNATRSVKSALYVARRIMLQTLDYLRYRRSMHLVNGNAMVARLAKSLDDLEVPILVGTRARLLIVEGPAIRGAEVESGGQLVSIRARHATVLACGGFANDVERQRELYPHAPTGREHWSAAPMSNTGDGLRLGEDVGGWVNSALASPAGLTPVSLVPRKDGTFGHFAHSLDRAKPGCIAVVKSGRRFANEADGYHDVTQAMIAASGTIPAEAWLICDHRFQRRYGLGRSRPAPFPIRAMVRSGYLKRSRTIEWLAEQCGIDAAALKVTVERYNHHARQGADPEFGRGTTPYNRALGDPSHKPNPCVAPIEQAPFYAVRIVPGNFSTFAGLETDAHARVLDREGNVIRGLFAVGNDMASVMGGFYPAGGINLGPAMVFGYVAGITIAQQSGHADGLPQGDGS